MSNIIEDYKKVLAERVALAPEDDYGADFVWKKAIAILALDVDATIDYIENECSYEDFEWMSEIFDELWEEYEKQGMQYKFAQALERTNKKFVSQGYTSLEDFIPPTCEKEVIEK